MNNHISFGVLIAILVFALFFVIITEYSDPLCNENANLIITTVDTMFAIIMIGYWIYCIVETFKSKKRSYGVILIVGLLIFFYVPLFLQQGIFLETGTSIFLLNLIIWCIYYAKYRNLCFLILIGGWLCFLLTLPYCKILWD